MHKGFAGIYIMVSLLILGAIAGVYYLGKNSSKPASKPTPVVTSHTPQASPTSQLTQDETVYTEGTRSANWTTYTSSFGYTFKYPEGLKIQNFSSSDFQALKETINIQPMNDLLDNKFFGFNGWVYVWDNLGIQISDLDSRKKWCTKLQAQLPGQLECANGDNFLIVDINGYKAYQAQGGRDNSLVQVMHIPYGNYVYEISLSDGDPEKLQFQQLNDQILSTFKLY